MSNAILNVVFFTLGELAYLFGLLLVLPSSTPGAFLIWIGTSFIVIAVLHQSAFMTVEIINRRRLRQ
jgi:hypothetical protein